MSYLSMTALSEVQLVEKLSTWQEKPAHKRSILLAVLQESRKSCLLILYSDLLTYLRHAHIYGIDLASSSELIAHHRDEESIAKHIGAVKVIYQTLEDLKSACAELSPRKNQEFEVGVFCGTYVTPVEPGYFEHLERVRGETKKIKVVENARVAVVNGLASEEELQIATNGAEVNGEGMVVPAFSNQAKDGSYLKRHILGKRSREGSGDATPPRDRMDISLHNFGDYMQDSHG